MALTNAQKTKLAIADHTQKLPEDCKDLPGLHFCPDWDFLPICNDSPEIECCTCEKE